MSNEIQIEKRPFPRLLLYARRYIYYPPFIFCFYRRILPQIFFYVLSGRADVSIANRVMYKQFLRKIPSLFARHTNTIARAKFPMGTPSAFSICSYQISLSLAITLFSAKFRPASARARAQLPVLFRSFARYRFRPILPRPATCPSSLRRESSWLSGRVGVTRVVWSDNAQTLWSTLVNASRNVAHFPSLSTRIYDPRFQTIAVERKQWISINTAIFIAVSGLLSRTRIPILKNMARFLDGHTRNERKRGGGKSMWNLRFFCADKMEIESVVRTRARTRHVYPARMIFDICSIWRICSRARLNDCARSRGSEDESAIRKDNKRIMERHKREEECQCLEDCEELEEKGEKRKYWKNGNGSSRSYSGTRGND